jgi:uncharacterized protein (TIGR03435 family)
MNTLQSIALWCRRPLVGAVTFLALIIPSLAYAQLIDVASVKENKEPRPEIAFGTGVFFRGDRVRVSDMTLESLVAYVYGITHSAHWDQLIVGWPEGLKDRRFDIVANLTKENLKLEDQRRAISEILTKRFGFKAHTEQRPLDVYRVRLAKPGALGRGLKKVTFDCGAIAPADAPKDNAGRSQCRQGSELGARMMRFHGSGDVATLVRHLSWFSQKVKRPVVDATGLTGFFTWDLEYDIQRADIPTEVREQLGLVLEPARLPIPVVVIGRVQMPTEN